MTTKLVSEGLAKDFKKETLKQHLFHCIMIAAISREVHAPEREAKILIVYGFLKNQEKNPWRYSFHSGEVQCITPRPLAHPVGEVYTKIASFVKEEVKKLQYLSDYNLWPWNGRAQLPVYQKIWFEY